MMTIRGEGFSARRPGLVFLLLAALLAMPRVTQAELSGPAQRAQTTALSLGSALSRKVHGNAGVCDIAIDTGKPIDGAVTIEPRAGPGHTIVFGFNELVTVAGSAVARDTSGAPVGSATASPSGNTVIVELAGIPDNRRIAVSLTGVNGSISAGIAIGFLAGDVDGNAAINAADLGNVKSRSGQTVNAGAGAGANTGVNNCRFDINVAGGINAADIAMVKARTGASLNAGVPPPPDFPTNDADASRLLAQATFGFDQAAIARVRQIGYRAWVDEQLAMPAQFSHLAQVKRVAAARTDQWQNRPAMWDINDSLWIGMADSNDQLRQRTMFALSQIFVISITDGSVYYLGNGVAAYVDMLYAKGFGNFRDLLESVTRSTAMGSYLSHIYNQKENPQLGSVPDQNYAREVMQLFSIGLWELNADGSRKLDTSGKPIPTYGNADIVGASRVLTGWTFDAATPANWGNYYGFWSYPDNAAQERPMKAFPEYHSTSAKSFLGVTIPASATPAPDADLTVLMDRLFNHPNVGPFIGKQLIQRLVTSNPSPAYVTRVTAAFNNNGSSVRGDMKAVLRAILLDPEARQAASVSNPQFGKIREPVLRMGHLLRTLKATRPADADSFGISQWLYDKRKGLWQTPLGSPTVFNFYRPDFRPANTALAQAGLVAPEMQLINQSTVDDIQWFFRDLLENGGITDCCSDELRNTFYTRLDYSALLPLVATPDALLDKLNAMFMSGQMTAALRANIKAEMADVNQDRSGTSGIIRGVPQLKLARALYVLLLSPEYVVQK